MSPISSNDLFLSIYVLNYLFIKAFFWDHPLSFSDMLFCVVLQLHEHCRIPPNIRSALLRSEGTCYKKGSFIELNCCWRGRKAQIAILLSEYNTLLLKSHFTSCGRINLFQLCRECLVNTAPQRKILFLEIKLLQSYCAGDVQPASSGKLWWCQWRSTKGIRQLHHWQTPCFTPFSSSRGSDFSQPADPWATNQGQPWPADCSSPCLRCR